MTTYNDYALMQNLIGVIVITIYQENFAEFVLGRAAFVVSIIYFYMRSGRMHSLKTLKL